MGAIKSVKSFYNWENGRTQPDADTFMYLCNLYNVKDIMPILGYGKESNTIPVENAKCTEKEKSLLYNFRKLNSADRRAACKAVEGFTYVKLSRRMQNNCII